MAVGVGLSVGVGVAGAMNSTVPVTSFGDT